MSYREISPLDRLLTFRSAGRGVNDVHVEEYLVEEIDEHGSLKFVRSGESAEFEQKKFPVEAQYQDSDGVWVHAILFLVDSKVDEIEIYKDDSSPIRRMPSPQDWEIFELPFS